MHRTFEDYVREQQARVASWLAEDAGAPIVTDICQLWVTTLAESGREVRTRGDFKDLPAELDLVARLAKAGFDLYAKALAWGLYTREGTPPAELPLICHALAVASGKSYALYGPDKLKWLVGFISTIDNTATKAFASSAAEVFRNNPNTLEALADFLKTVVEQANENPDRVTDIPPCFGSMALMVAEFSRDGNFQDVWHADHLPVFFRWSAEFDFFRRVAPERFVQLIDELPHPAMVDECLNFPALIEDPDEITQLLTLAGSAFDNAGAWRPRGVAAVVLLKLATTKLIPSGRFLPGDLADDAGELGEDIAQFTIRAESLVTAVVSRPDGVLLGLRNCSPG